jgi:predicted SnoaL-like aldol condensation-catalyzing enzyme
MSRDTMILDEFVHPGLVAVRPRPVRRATPPSDAGEEARTRRDDNPATTKGHRVGTRLDNATAIYLEAIRDGDVDAIHRYAGDRYTQHSTPVKDGREGFIEFFDDFIRRNPVRDIEIVRGFEDGQYVFLHAVQRLNDGEYRYVTADIFGADADGKLIEHWDMIAEMTDDTVSGHSQVDGPTEVTDLDRTEEKQGARDRLPA